jgi:hypothetical protein
MTNILDKKYLMISVIGPHAGESETEIFNRKIQDISRIGKTFWLIKSYKAKPEIVNKYILEAKNEITEIYCIFIGAASKNGAIPTISASSSSSFSKDKSNWEDLPTGLSPVTGKIDNNTYALVFDYLELTNDCIDLWNYSDFINQNNPIKIRQGGSTFCSIRKDSSYHPDKIISRYRIVYAIGKLSEPYCVYLR